MTDKRFGESHALQRLGFARCGPQEGRDLGIPAFSKARVQNEIPAFISPTPLGLPQSQRRSCKLGDEPWGINNLQVTSACAVSSWDCPGAAELLLHLPGMSEPTRGALGLHVGSGWCSGCLPPAVSAQVRSPQRSRRGTARLRGPWRFPEVPPLPAAFPTCFFPSLFPREGRGGGRAKLGPPPKGCASHTLTPQRSGLPAAGALGNAGRSQQRLLALPAHFWHAFAVW